MYSYITSGDPGDDYLVKTKCYYLIKFDQIFGTLYIKKDCITFEPDPKAQENQHLLNGSNTDFLTQNMKVEEYECTLDYLDLLEANLMPLINEKAAMSESQFVQKNYKHDMFLQIVLTAVNGITLKQTKDSSLGALLQGSGNSIVTRSKTPIANLYFKCVHYDLPHSSNGFQYTQLTNHYQQIIV